MPHSEDYFLTSYRHPRSVYLSDITSSAAIRSRTEVRLLVHPAILHQAARATDRPDDNQQITCMAPSSRSLVTRSEL